MDIGRLNKRISFLTYRETEDCMGQSIQVPQKGKTVWGTIKPLRGGEYWDAAKKEAEITHKITTRYLPGITPDEKILYKDRIFEIQSIINVDENNTMLEIYCKEYLGREIKNYGL